MAYAEVVKRNDYRNALDRLRAPTPTSVSTLHQSGATQSNPGGLDMPRELRVAFVEEFGDRWAYAWEVSRCETGGFRPDVIYGPTRGAAGERGLFQLLSPGGVGDAFLAAGYTDFFDPYQQIAFVAVHTVENGWLAWRNCLP